MGWFLSNSKQQMEDVVRTLGVEPDANYLLVYNRMNRAAKVAANLLLRTPSTVTGQVEKQHCMVFTPDQIIVRRLTKHPETTLYSASAITNFTYRDGEDDALIIDFDCNNEHLSFYTHKDFTMRMKYIAENLQVLLNNNFLGYAN